MPDQPLTPRQQRFVVEYLKDLNATQAAIRAGYSTKNAEHNGARLLGNVGIKAAISAAQAPVLEQAQLSAVRTLEEVRRIAFSNIKALFDAAGNLKDMNVLTEEEAACIASVEVIKKNITAGDGKMDMVHKIRLWDKPKSLDLACRHFALLTDQVKVKVEHDIQNMTTEELKALARELGGE